MLLSVPARELKRSSNSYYKAINLWVLTYASPLAIWFLYLGMTVRLAALVPVFIRCDCHLLVNDSTAPSGSTREDARVRGIASRNHGEAVSSISLLWLPSLTASGEHALVFFLDPASDFKRMLRKSGESVV